MREEGHRSNESKSSSISFDKHIYVFTRRKQKAHLGALAKVLDHTAYGKDGNLRGAEVLQSTQIATTSLFGGGRSIRRADEALLPGTDPNIQHHWLAKSPIKEKSTEQSAGPTNEDIPI